MIDELELRVAVDAAFAVTGRGLAPWPDPHPDRVPLDEEYSRLLNPTKWRIIGACADAWLGVLVQVGLAVVERNASIRWLAEPTTVISRADRIVPSAPGAIPLVIARSRLGDDDAAGVTLGVGDPSACLMWFPHCGCDACDSGSQDELDRLDDRIGGVVSGTFRRLSEGSRTITVHGERLWSSSGHFDRREVEAILADPTGWDELAGASWFGPA